MDISRTDDDIIPEPVEVPTEEFSKEPEVPRFSDAEERQIEVIEEGIVRAQKRAEPAPPSEVVFVEPVFTGTYKRRFHWIGIVGIWIALPLVGLMTILAFILGNMLSSAAATFLPNFKYLDWLSLWLPLAAGVILTLLVLVRSFSAIVEWWHRWLIITEEKVILRTNVPGFLLNLILRIQDDEITLERVDVRSVRVNPTWLGELLNYATITFETTLQGDVRFHNLRFVARPNKVKALFD
jgi:hypothetical protein